MFCAGIFLTVVSFVRGPQESEEEDMESEKEEEMGESEGEMESRDAAGRPASQNQAVDGTGLSKRQERELRQLRKADFSWVSTALHS